MREYWCQMVVVKGRNPWVERAVRFCRGVGEVVDGGEGGVR
jgi:hypothetical protein